ATQLLEVRDPGWESCTMLLGELPSILSPIITLTSIPSYRKYFMRQVHRRPIRSIILHADRSPSKVISDRFKYSL
ncbi:hypothetical protein PFISCL1PPCAC_9646, partial [Pristionchus fissidentatus]